MIESMSEPVKITIVVPRTTFEDLKEMEQGFNNLMEEQDKDNFNDLILEILNAYIYGWRLCDELEDDPRTNPFP